MLPTITNYPHMSMLGPSLCLCKVWPAMQGKGKQCKTNSFGAAGASQRCVCPPREPPRIPAFGTCTSTSTPIASQAHVIRRDFCVKACKAWPGRICRGRSWASTGSRRPGQAKTRRSCRGTCRHSQKHSLYPPGHFLRRVLGR